MLQDQINKALRVVPKHLSDWSIQTAIGYKECAKKAMQLLGHKRQTSKKLSAALAQINQYIR